MKKLLFILLFIPFLANAQSPELDKIYLREALALQDSTVTNITEGDTLLTLERANIIIADSSKWDNATGGINYAGGNVGIGTSTPLQKLHINCGNFNTGTIFESDDDGLFVNITTPSNDWIFGQDTGEDFIIRDVTGGNKDIFQIENGGAANSIYINGSGVGIYDNSPSYGLDVNGTGRFTGIVNFDVFPITPSSAPTTDYQVANKKYVDDNPGSLPSGNDGDVIMSDGSGLGKTDSKFNFDGDRLNLSSNTGTANTLIGLDAGGTLGSSSASNVCVGRDAGELMTSTATNNTFIGTFAGNSATGSGNVFIGYSAGYTATVSNSLYIDNIATSNPLIFGDFNARKLIFNCVANLAQLSNQPTGSTDLAIATTKYVDDNSSGGAITIDTLQIGSWDMDASANKAVTHGLTYADIIGISSIIIRNDADLIKYPLDYSLSSTSIEGRYTITTTAIALNRSIGGLFDSTDFDYTFDSWNRGWIIIMYRE